MPLIPDSIRLAIGTLTRMPVPAPRNITPSTAGSAMMLAPMVGLCLALVCGVPMLIVRDSGHSLILAAASLALLAWATRGLHLDGLADMADALGSGKPASQALEIARKSDVGPFGVVVVAFTLLLQVFALSGCIDRGYGYLAFVLAITTSRTALTVACVRGVPAARSDGLGAMVAGSVPRVVAALWAILVLTAGLALFGPIGIGAVLLGLLTSVATIALARRRLGGITGDVLGTIAEVSATGTLMPMS